MTATLRATVGLSADEAAALGHLTDATDPQAIALDSLTGITLGLGASTAQQVHALVVAGLKAVEKKAEEIGYTRQAAFERDHPDCVAWRNLLSTRRLPSFLSPKDDSDTVAGAA